VTAHSIGFSLQQLLEHGTYRNGNTTGRYAPDKCSCQEHYDASYVVSRITERLSGKMTEDDAASHTVTAAVAREGWTARSLSIRERERRGNTRCTS
jgi:hypothetical protein